MRLPLLWLLLFACSSSAFAYAPSGEDWLTLSTPHFRVHHTKPLETFARAIARSLEHALPLLEKDLRWKAPTPVDVVVMDSSDQSNGAAINFPNTHIELYSVPFESESNLSYYVNWPNELATHELTHIIANDSSTGFYDPFRAVFGSIIKPNGLQPVWLIEGLAVYEETAHTPGGRGRSPQMEALLREAIRQGKLTDPSYTSIDRFNDGNEFWPGPNTPYFMGYTVQALGERAHPGLVGDLSLSNAGRFPFLPDANLDKFLNRNWADLWSTAPATLKGHFPTDPSAARSCFLTNSGGSTGGAALSPDGWVYFTEQSFDYGTHLARVRANGPCDASKIDRLVYEWNGAPAQVAVNKSGKLVAFTQFDEQHFEHFFSDLWFYYPTTGKSEQVTNGARARDPAFTNGAVLYVSEKPDTSQVIVRRDLPSGRETELWACQPLERIANLSANDLEVAFSLHDNQGHEKIQILKLNEASAPSPILPKAPFREWERNPQLLPNGQVLYAYGTDRSQEIRLITDRATGEVQTIARSESGYLDRPFLLPGGKEILASDLSLRGTDLARLPVNPQAAEAPAKGPDLFQYITGNEPVPLDTPAKLEEEFPPSAPYNALTTPATSLWPQYWMPELAFAPDGVLLGASTSGNDPLNYHQYGVLAQYDSRANFPRLNAYYTNRVSTTLFHVQMDQSNNYFSSTRTSNRNTAYTAEADLPLGGHSTFGFGAGYTQRALYDQSSGSSQVYATLSYIENGSTPGALEPNFGYVLYGYAALYPDTKGESAFYDFRPQAALFFHGFAPTHAVALYARAGISTNHNLYNNYYLGGGLSVLNTSFFTVRGYPVDALLGQKLATVNFSYSLPLGYPYRGFGTWPLFLKTWGLRFDADAGSANYISQYENNTFLSYRGQRLGQYTIAGFGLDALAQGDVFYHVPVTATAGIHYGPMKEYGGSLAFYFGLNIGLSTSLGATPAKSGAGF